MLFLSSLFFAIACQCEVFRGACSFARSLSCRSKLVLSSRVKRAIFILFLQLLSCNKFFFRKRLICALELAHCQGDLVVVDAFSKAVFPFRAAFVFLLN